MTNSSGHQNILALVRPDRSKRIGKKAGAVYRHTIQRRAIFQEIKLLVEPFASLRDIVIVTCSNQSSGERAELADFSIDTDGEIKMYVRSCQSENVRTVIRVNSDPHAINLNELQRQSLLSLLAYLEKKAPLFL